MRPTLYVETSIISYLAAHPSRDLITAAHQQTTHTWWRERRHGFDLYASQVVLDEKGYSVPVLCTPDELMGEFSHEG